jgi:phage tail sheath protein FI
MAFQVSPGVNVSEIDLTTVVPAVSTTEGGIAGNFRWGPIDQLTLVTSEDQLVGQFQKPTSSVNLDFFTAANFLSYGNALYVVRVATTGQQNATLNAANSAATLIKGADDYENNYSSGIANVGDYVARYAGALGNSLKVSVCASATAYQSTLSGTYSVTSNTSTITFSANQASTLVAGDLLEIGLTAGSKQTVKVASVAANGTTATLETTYTGDTAAANTSLVRKWEYATVTDRAPGTSNYATQRGGSADEMHIVVADEDGLWTGVKGQVVEVYQNVSMASDAKTETGATNYYKDVINNRSQYMWWTAHNGSNTNAGSAAQGTTFAGGTTAQTASFVNGADGSAPTAAQINAGYNKFKNVEDVDVSFLLAAGNGQTVVTNLINNIAEVRKDLLICLSPTSTTVVDNASYEGKQAEDVIAYRNSLPSSSYAVMDSAWKYQYDKYNDVYRYVPANGDTAGAMVRTDSVRDPWFSPAGFNRGQIRNVVKLAWNPSKAERDTLYKNGVNPIVTFPGQGTVLYGDKTLTAGPSSFDRINVRRLFIVLEKAIATAANQTLFEFNDEFTRAQFRNLVEPFLRDVKGRRGVSDFRVICDATNNTDQIVESNQFVGDIYIKPPKSINFIQLNFVAVRTGVEFSEITGQ